MQRCNIVAFPYPQMVEKAVALGLLLETRKELSVIAEDMAILNALLSELHRLALSAHKILETTGHTIQAEIVGDRQISRSFP
jgi:hypothetical protein